MTTDCGSAAVSSAQLHANGLMPWPYLGLGCSQEQTPARMDSTLHPFGMPCHEGGAVAVENVALRAGVRLNIKHCMVFYTPERYVAQHPVRQPAPPFEAITERMRKVEQVVGECISSGEIREAPVDLARISSCIMYRSSLSDVDNFPCQGAAVMPKQARSPLQAVVSWSRAKYSAFKAPQGYLYQQNVPIEVRAKGLSYGVLDLSILIHSPVT